MSAAPALNDLAKTNRIFENDVIDKGDYDALKHVYTQNARALPPGAETVCGRAELGVAGAEAKVTVKYIVVWRQEDGAWKWDVDIWNAIS